MTIVNDDTPKAVNWNSDALRVRQGDRPRAVTLTHILIDQALDRNRLCANCGETHWTWQCPEIADRLFAPEPTWKDVALGRELCRMRWHDVTYFARVLSCLTPDDLIIYAASYQAFIRSHAPNTDLTINAILKAWRRIIGEHSDGPAAPALRAA